MDLPSSMIFQPKPWKKTILICIKEQGKSNWSMTVLSPPCTPMVVCVLFPGQIASTHQIIQTPQSNVTIIQEEEIHCRGTIYSVTHREADE